VVEITSKAKEDLKEFELETREGLLDEIEERLDKDRDNVNISYINKPEFGIEFQRLKIKSEEFDHRVYFDYINSELLILAVRHRDYAYSQEDLKEVEERLNDLERE